LRTARYAELAEALDTRAQHEVRSRTFSAAADAMAGYVKM
jgi:hypothetical protein